MRRAPNLMNPWLTSIWSVGETTPSSNAADAVTILKVEPGS